MMTRADTSALLVGWRTTCRLMQKKDHWQFGDLLAGSLSCLAGNGGLAPTQEQMYTLDGLVRFR